MHTCKLFGHVFRRLAIGCSLNGRLALVFERCGPTYGKLGGCREELNLWLREQGKQVARACRRQFEFIAAQRVRRSVQIFHLYTRIWDEVALREFMRSWRIRLTTNILMSGVVGVTMYNWDRERISDDEINRCSDDIEDIYRLRDDTVVCAKCRLRTVIDVEQPNIEYCMCNDKSSCVSSHHPEGWAPFIERQDMLIWRRQEPGGLYAYKVYGSFPDVTADDFLQVQVDIDYRMEWDNTAEKLEIVESDPLSESSSDHRSDIVYWEMIWPKLFSNRDYVYQRRWVVDKEKRVIIIVSRVTEHPEVPVRRGTHRVKSYWSYMVIRPYTDFHEPGIEFGLTYFDDPGVVAPSAVTAWVALRGLPDFLMRMRQATKNYQNYKLLKQGATSLSNSNPLTLPTNEQVQQDDSTKNTDELDIIQNVQRNDVTENDNKDISASSNEQDICVIM